MAPGINMWSHKYAALPNIGKNISNQPAIMANIVWSPSMMAVHPGTDDVCNNLRFTAPIDGEYNINISGVEFDSNETTTVTHLYVNGKYIISNYVNLEGKGPDFTYEGTFTVNSGDFIDVLTGGGPDGHSADTTGLSVVITAPDGVVYDAAKDFSIFDNPNGVWSYGGVPSRDALDSFALYDCVDTTSDDVNKLPVYANPFSDKWSADMDDIHPYRSVPHTESVAKQVLSLPVFPELGIDNAKIVADTIRKVVCELENEL
jgi:hypothetical protein